jgi:hypothetical protein
MSYTVGGKLINYKPPIPFELTTVLTQSKFVSNSITYHVCDYVANFNIFSSVHSYRQLN